MTIRKYISAYVNINKHKASHHHIMTAVNDITDVKLIRPIIKDYDSHDAFSEKEEAFCH